MKKILQKEALILRGIAKEIPVEQIKSYRIKTIIREMKGALDGQEDGVAIAAPQIGYSLRIFVISKRIFDINKTAPTLQSESRPKASAPKRAQDMVFINPRIIKASREKKVVEEGCLSVRFLYGKVSRSNKATIEAYDESGKKVQRGGTGLLAQIFQHEVDHLNGILFIDKAKYVEEILPKQTKRQKIKNEKR